MFNQITINLDNEYSINAVYGPVDIIVSILKGQAPIGKARLTTDHVDVTCITLIQIDDEFVETKFNDQYTLGEILLKFLIKFPNVVRKPEFRFILDAPDNLKNIIYKHHFDNGEESDLKNDILIRTKKIEPLKKENPKNIRFTQSIQDEDLPKLLCFLNKNAYWQAHLTLERLTLLIKNSQCFFALSELNEIVGFSRVLTNCTTFASLWDVVVDEQYRGRGIGISLMHKIFSDNTLSNIDTWVLFTDTAKGLYEKFGFISEGEVSDRKLVHKLRLQGSNPSYMSALIQTTANNKPVNLSVEQTFKFLFGKQGKRGNLPTFWDEISQINKSARLSEDECFVCIDQADNPRDLGV